jgi:two-component system sensor histidine kinase UhpB
MGMISRFLPNWSIAARLLAVAVLPAGIMFLAVTASLYLSVSKDVRRDVADRGRVTATALAQSSQYALVSGNTGYLKTTLRKLLEADRSIACIDVMDASHRTVESDCQTGKPDDVITFDEPIVIASLPSDDLFESMDLKEIPGVTPGKPVDQNKEKLRTVGHVRVTMSPAPIFETKRRALAASYLLLLLAAMVSCMVGLRLAQRLRLTLGSVMSALRSIRQGQFAVPLDTSQKGELGELQRTIVEMAVTLDAARHDLEQQVAARTQELQEAVKRARQADAEKRRLIVHSNAAVEEERRRIAVDIHDHLGAALISVRLEASGLAARARAIGDADMEQEAKRIARTADSIYGTTRNIVKSLRPEIIDTLGLSGAIEELVRHVDQIHPACRFTFTAARDLPDLRGKQAMPAYRVAQEALNNIVKHAHATQATVNLSLAPYTGHLHLMISDNGRGFDPRSDRNVGIGLIGMRERVAAVGGELHLSSTPGQGTILSVTLPLDPPPDRTPASPK